MALISENINQIIQTVFGEYNMGEYLTTLNDTSYDSDLFGKLSHGIFRLYSIDH